MLLIVKIFGEKITEHFENSHRKLDLKIAQHEEQKALALAQAEKAKLARAKTKAKKNK